MSDISLFNFEGSQVRVLVDGKGEPWFVANDIAAALGYERPQKAVLDHVPNDDLLIQEVIDSIGRAQNTNTINESGMYALIMSSKLEGAKRFKRWVTAEVLPSIRKTGSYSRNPAPPQYAIKSEAESQASIIRDTGLFLQNLIPNMRPEMLAACTMRALKVSGLISASAMEEMRNAIATEWDKAPLLTPTQIGEKLGGLNPKQVNKMLEARGLQKKAGKKWEPTSDGKEYAGAVSFQSEHGEHKGVQLKWAPEIVELLQEPMQSAPATKLLT